MACRSIFFAHWNTAEAEAFVGGSPQNVVE